MNRLTAWALAAVLLLMTVAGCRRDEPQGQAERAPNDPVAAVEAQAQALRDNDLVRWSKLSLPEALYAQRQALWQQRQADADPADIERAGEYAAMMARLTAPDAETALMRDLEIKLQEFEAEVGDQWPLMQAALGMFVQAAIEANTEIDPAERAHARELAGGLVQWLQPALITDRERARRAIAELVATARELDLPTLEQARALPMEAAMAKAGIALAGLKRVAKIYELDLDAALAQMRAEAVSVQGDEAVVRVTYPLFGRELRMELPMQRRDGGWYAAGTLRDTEQEIAEAAGAAADATAEAVELETGDEATPEVAR